VWDAEGRLLYSSTNQGAPVTALAWSWNAQLLAVGAHDSVRLCNASGVSLMYILNILLVWAFNNVYYAVVTCSRKTN
jgi:hypothetical protein